ncbi:MAG: hypothetical protein G01um101416_1066 [Microgenomates group bacterium Gr01-1014_16]|nr:MAG: hypothetical protein G01um101416_1066 [Microgenomates group bacterium Gr01-1014_16]
MKKISPIRFKFVYVNSPESQRRVTLAYGRMFELARKRLVLESLSTPEYIKNNGGQRGVSDTGGGGRAVEGEKDNHLSDVPGREDSGGEVWESVADKQPIVYGFVPRKGD